MKVEEIMTSGLITTDINASIKEVANIMKTNDIGFIGVMENNSLVGVLTDRDLVIRGLVNGDETITNSVSKTIVNIEKTDNVDKALQLMGRNKIKRLIVMDNNKPAGVVSLSDILDSDYTSTISRAISQIYSLD